jgi:mediator of replication checkpoint protein 1
LTAPESDEELPDAYAILEEHSKKKKAEDEAALKKERVRKLKAQVLAQKSKAVVEDDGDDDDDLEIVEETTPKVEKHLKRASAMTKTAKNVLTLAKVSSSRRHTTRGGSVHSDEEDELLKVAARPVFETKSRHSSAAMGHAELQQVLLHKTERQNRELTKAKEEEWVRRGGKLKSALRSEVSSEANQTWDVAQLARKLLEQQKEVADTQSTAVDHGNESQAEDNDDSDGEYQPADRGSASPRGSGDEGEGSDADIDENSDQESAKEQVEGTDGEDERPIPERRGRRSLRAILDDSDEENIPPNRVLVPETSMLMDDDDENIRLQVLAHRGSRSSLEETTPDEDDKENDTRLMFDRGEDKENAVVPRHMPLGLSARPSLGGPRSSGIFELTEGVRTSLSMSPSSANVDESSRPMRKPLQSKAKEFGDDPFAWPSAATLSNSPPVMRKGIGSLSSSPVALKSAFSLSRKESGFADLFDDDDGVPPPAALLPPSEIDAGSAPKPLTLGKMDDLFSQDEVSSFVGRRE